MTRLFLEEAEEILVFKGDSLGQFAGGYANPTRRFKQEEQPSLRHNPQGTRQPTPCAAHTHNASSFANYSSCHYYRTVMLKSMNTYTNTPTHALATMGQNGTDRDLTN